MLKYVLTMHLFLSQCVFFEYDIVWKGFIIPRYTCVIFTWNYLDRLWCIYEWACILISKDIAGGFTSPAILHS